MQRIKIALLGCGDVAQRDYLPEFHRIEDRVELTAVCGRAEDRVRGGAARYGFKAWFTDYRRMLAATDAEAVINLTPMQLHDETNLATLRAGRHLYSEKPVAGSLSEARAIQAAARETGKVAVCAPCVMIFPQIRLALSLINEGVIGDIHSGRGVALGGPPPWEGFTSDPSPYFAAGGGPLRDMGVYPLHALTGLIGPAKRIAAFAATTQTEYTLTKGPFAGKTVPVETPDTWRLLLDFGGGRQATVEANYTTLDTRAPQLELFGTQGTLAVNLLDVGAPVELYTKSGGWESRAVPIAGRGGGPDHLLGVIEMLECIRDNRKPILSLDHALHVVEIIERAEESAREGQAKDILGGEENEA